MESITSKQSEILVEIEDALFKFFKGESDADDIESKGVELINLKDEIGSGIGGFRFDNLLMINQFENYEDNMYYACLFYVWIRKLLRGETNGN